jgi:hypothetical protein
MRLYLDSVVGLLQERSAEELIVGVFLALLLAVTAAGVHALVRRKVKDTVLLLTVVGLIANLIAMTFTASYVRMSLRNSSIRNSNHILPRPVLSTSQVRDLTFEASARTILQAADLDRDGKLSAAEAAEASARFVQLAESEAGKPMDWQALSSAIRRRVRIFDHRPVDRDHPPSPSPGPEAQFHQRISRGEPDPPPDPPLAPKM